jgi:predicted porin
MFKKTLIAMAVASVVAAPIASADVKISGVVEQTFTDTDNSGEGYTASTFNMLNITASEDLGNGMSAFAKYNMLTKAGTSTGETNGDMVVGISSGFGTIVAGTMEDFTEGKLAAMMSMEGTTANELSGNANRTAGGLAYVSPTMNGLHFGIAGYAGTGAADTSNFDAVDVAVFYDNGPLSIKVAQETLNNATANAVAATATTAAGTADQKTTSIGASYVVGDLKVAALSVKRENQRVNASNAVQADSTDFMFKGTYKMGNNSLTLGYAKDDSDTTGDNDVTSVELIHNFSSRTSAYVGFSNNDATAAADDSTFFGLKHKF